MSEGVYEKALSSWVFFPHLRVLPPVINNQRRLWWQASIHRLILPHITYPCYSIKEEAVINDSIVMYSVCLHVKHTLCFQAGIIPFLFAAGLPGCRGLSVFSLPWTELLRWATGLCHSPCGSGISRVQGITWPHIGKCALCSRTWGIRFILLDTWNSLDLQQ